MSKLKKIFRMANLRERTVPTLQKLTTVQKILKGILNQETLKKFSRRSADIRRFIKVLNCTVWVQKYEQQKKRIN